MPRRPHLNLPLNLSVDRSRLAPPRVRGVVLLGVSLVLLPALAACSPDKVSLPAPGPSSEGCADFVAALPATLDDQTAREVTPSDAAGRAWGDPAFVVTCGVGEPGDLAPTSTCVTVDGVDWYVPKAEYLDPEADATLTTIDFRPRVSLVVPHDYRPSGAAAALTDLAATIKAHLKKVDGCA